MELTEYEKRLAALGIARGKLAETFTEPRKKTFTARKLVARVEPGPDLSHLNPKHSKRYARNCAEGWAKASKRTRYRWAAQNRAKARILKPRAKRL